MASLGDRTQARLSLAPAGAAFLVGLLLHAVEQAMFLRAGPLPVLLTAPVVATLAFLAVRAASYRRLAALVAWGAVSTGAGILLLYLATVNYVLPRAMTGWEMVAYDLALFCWFVLSLTGVYVLAARNGNRERLLFLLAPVVQGAFAAAMRVLVVTGLYA